MVFTWLHNLLGRHSWKLEFLYCGEDKAATGKCASTMEGIFGHLLLKGKDTDTHRTKKQL